jgi:hypothetical protein
MIEGSGSGSIPLTNGSGPGSMRPKNMWIRWIRIRNTAFGWLARPSGSRSSSLSSRPLNTLPYSPLLSVKLRKILVFYKRGGYRLKDFKIKLAGQKFLLLGFDENQDEKWPYIESPKLLSFGSKRKRPLNQNQKRNTGLIICFDKIIGKIWR